MGGMHGVDKRQKGWFRAARTQWFETAQDAAHACGVSPRLIEYLESGSVTAPELAKRIGETLGLTKDQINAITCQESLARRELERHYKTDERIVMARY